MRSLADLQTNPTYVATFAIALIFGALLMYVGLRHFKERAWIFIVGFLIALLNVWIFIFVHTK